MSPRTQRNPANRVQSKLFEDLHTDKFGYLLPPIANPDLPLSIDSRGDSFWVSERENSVLRIKKNTERRHKRTFNQKRGSTVQVEELKNPLSEDEWNPSSDESDVNEDELVSVVGPNYEQNNENPIKWHHAIDAAIALAQHIAKRRQNSSQNSSQKSTSRNTNESEQITIEEIIEDYKSLSTE